MSNSRLDEIKINRLEKLNQLKKLGINPYPAKFSRPFNSISQALDQLNREVSVVGRIWKLRSHGQVTFADIRDESGQIQVLFQAKSLQEKYELLKLLDTGDFIGVTGEVIRTQAGQITVNSTYFELLSKSLRPLPDEWYGLKDEETRYRQRYVDLLLDDHLKELFRKKAVFWQSIRNFLIGKNFLEVETPVLENVFGGADANPFITHHDAMDTDLYLRISMGELWQKRLMVGGYEKTFEIGRQFRNEGLSREHLQDYTQMEFYWAYANYEDSRNLVRDMYRHVAQAAFGTQQFKINNFSVDLAADWQLIDFTTAINDHLQVDISSASIADLQTKLNSLNIPFTSADDKGRLIDLLWKQVRKSIAGPAFLIGHPVEVSPLAKRIPHNPDFVERYQVILAGSEMGNGYSELNDPVDQAERFASQQALRDHGDKEAQMYDEDYVRALEYGMPPVSGFGVSERLFAFLADKPVRETVLFPLLRPEVSLKTEKQDFQHKMVVVIDSSIPQWQIMNTSAHIAAFLGNKLTVAFDTGKYFYSKDGVRLPRNSQHPIVTLSATPQQIKTLVNKVRETNLLFIGYVPEMMKTSDDSKLAKMLSEKTDEAIIYTGIGIFGPTIMLDELTKEFPLWGKN